VQRKVGVDQHLLGQRSHFERVFQFPEYLPRGIVKKLSKNVKNGQKCQNRSKNVKIGQKMSKLVKKCH
jgi:hypothetical protein